MVKHFKPKKVFTKLLFSYAAMILLTLLIFGLVFIYFFHVNLYQEFEETYAHYYEQMEHLLQESERFEWNEEMRIVGLKPTLNHKAFHVFMVNDDGETVYGPTDSKMNVQNIDSDLLHRIVNGDEVSEGTRINGDLSYIISAPLNDHLQSIVDADIMFMVFHDLDHQYVQMISRMVVTLVITVLVISILLWLISKRITNPLRNMNDIALQFSKGDFSNRVNVVSDDEIGQLGDSLNEMATELSKLEGMRKDFIANVSHDLRSPLTSMKGFLVALLDGTIPEDKKSHYYLLMKEETERVIKLVNDTLDMTQLEADQVSLNCKIYNISRQVQGIMVKLEPQLMNKNLSVKLEPVGEQIEVYADYDRIEQALINLLQNAIQFSPQDAVIHILLEKKGQQVRVNIHDQGAGIPADQLPHIWTRFYKAEKSRTNKSGAGIGLSIVKSIIELHGSTVVVESKHGEGTTFSFILPSAGRS